MIIIVGLVILVGVSAVGVMAMAGRNLVGSARRTSRRSPGARR
ncbi:hypothetical protein [Trebonia kvetii]|nr:hypothetical protein [Trebonia kvetii]